MRNFEGIIFIQIWIYREIFKSALVCLIGTSDYLLVYLISVLHQVAECCNYNWSDDSDVDEYAK